MLQGICLIIKRNAYIEGLVFPLRHVHKTCAGMVHSVTLMIMKVKIQYRCHGIVSNLRKSVLFFSIFL